MTQITRVMLTAGPILLATLVGVIPGSGPLAELKAQPARGPIVTLDGAADCRTLGDNPVRGGAFIINGKLFPAGTLPSGAASNDPALPLNGVAPIGEWVVRGQHATPFPPAVASLYSSTPFDHVTQYYMFDNGRNALTAEGYISTLLSTVPLSITGGIGNFSGASGDLEGTLLGTNLTGCPNFRVRFHIQPGSIRGNSFN